MRNRHIAILCGALLAAYGPELLSAQGTSAQAADSPAREPAGDAARGAQAGPAQDEIVYRRPESRSSPATILVMNVPRGGTECVPPGAPPLQVTVLAPRDHTGLTSQEQPALFWHLSSDTTCPVVLTLTSPHTPEPLLEQTLKPPLRTGIHRLRLGDHGIRLKIGVSYRWSVAVVPDQHDRSKDLFIDATIERSETPETLRAGLAAAPKASLAAIYAGAGFWYDALGAISDQVDAAPNDPLPRRRRDSLLKQIDALSAVSSASTG